MTLAIELVREVINANLCINFQIRLSIRLAVRVLTDTHTNRADSITSTTDTEGKKNCLSVNHQSELKNYAMNPLQTVLQLKDLCRKKYYRGSPPALDARFTNNLSLKHRIIIFLLLHILIYGLQ